HSIAGQRTDLDAAAIFRVDPIRYRISVGARVPAARGRDHHAIDGSPRGHELFPASWNGGEWRAAPHQRRWQSDSVATSVLVSWSPGSLRFDPASIRDRRRNP